MFPAPPFSMFRYARQVRQVPGSVHVPQSGCAAPGMDSDDVHEYMQGLLLEERDSVPLPRILIDPGNIILAASIE